MKELDFLPEWYRQKNRRKTHYHEQYTALVSLLVIMLTWSFFSINNVVRVEAQCQALQNAQLAQVQSTKEIDSIQNELDQLKSKTDILKSVDSKIIVSDVFAELSFLIDGPIILNNVEIKKEKCVVEPGDQTHGPMVKVASGSFTNKSSSAKEERYRFRIMITGVAADAAEVARLLCELEKSSYFCNVVPDFSRNRIIQGHQVSEFEIYCYIANYSLGKK